MAKRQPRVCATPKCNRELHRRNKSGLCAWCSWEARLEFYRCRRCVLGFIWFLNATVAAARLDRAVDEVLRRHGAAGLQRGTWYIGDARTGRVTALCSKRDGLILAAAGRVVISDRRMIAMPREVRQ